MTLQRLQDVHISKHVEYTADSPYILSIFKRILTSGVNEEVGTSLAWPHQLDLGIALNNLVDPGAILVRAR